MCRRRSLRTLVFCLVLGLAPAHSQYVTDVPYFHQYFNSVNPSGSCQNTTIAITLGYYGAELHPDDLSRQYGTEKAQTVTGWEQIFNAQALRFGLTVRDSSLDNASLSDVHQRLDRGLPVPVHGAFTASGHLIVLLGYDDDYYYVHDPAGDWSRSYQLDTPTAGRYARYPRQAVVRAIQSPLNGYIRMHRLFFETGGVTANWIDAPPDTVVAGDRQSWRAHLQVSSASRPLTITADLGALGGGTTQLLAVDDSTWLLSADFLVARPAGRRQVQLEIRAGDDHLQLRHAVAVMAADDEELFLDRLAATWSEAFVYNTSVAQQSGTVFTGSQALQFDAQSFIYELRASTPVDWTGYGALRFAFHPGNTDGGRTPAFSILANEDPRALVKLLDGSLADGGVDLSLDEWQIVNVPLTAFSWLESPLTSLRFFGSLRGTFFLDDIKLVADRPFPFHLDWRATAADSVRLGERIDVDLGVRLHGDGNPAAAQMTADLSDLGGPAATPLLADEEGVHRLHTTLDVARSSNGLAHIRIDITYAEGTHSWHAGISQSVVVVPQADVILYDDHLIGPWHEVTATNVTIEPVQGDIVYAGSSAMAWQVNNLIVEYGTDTPVDPVGFDVLRLHVHPGTAMPGRLGAFSVLFNGDSRTVVRLLGTTGGLDINRRQWQEIDIPLRDLKLQEPIRSVRFLGDLSGKLYVDDVRFVAAGLMQQPTAVIMQATGTAKGFALDGAWPNPFNSGTVIGFRLATGAQIDLAIYDMLGQQVAQVASGWRDAGSHRASWDGRTRTGATAASGVYLYRLLCRTSSSAHTVAGKLMLLR